MSKELVAAPVALDEHVELLAAYNKCAENEKFWRDKKEEIKEQITKLLGEATLGTIDGKPAFTYEYTDRMRTEQFRKDHPDLWQAYQRPVTKDEFDMGLFRLARPGLYHEYQSRSAISKWKG